MSEARRFAICHTRDATLPEARYTRVQSVSARQAGSFIEITGGSGAKAQPTLFVHLFGGLRCRGRCGRLLETLPPSPIIADVPEALVVLPVVKAPIIWIPAVSFACDIRGALGLGFSFPGDTPFLQVSDGAMIVSTVQLLCPAVVHKLELDSGALSGSSTLNLRRRIRRFNC